MIRAVLFRLVKSEAVQNHHPFGADEGAKELELVLRVADLKGPNVAPLGAK